MSSFCYFRFRFSREESSVISLTFFCSRCASLSSKPLHGTRRITSRRWNNPENTNLVIFISVFYCPKYPCLRPPHPLISSRKKARVVPFEVSRGQWRETSYHLCQLLKGSNVVMGTMFPKLYLDIRCLLDLADSMTSTFPSASLLEDLPFSFLLLFSYTEASYEIIVFLNIFIMFMVFLFFLMYMFHISLF